MNPELIELHNLVIRTQQVLQGLAQQSVAAPQYLGAGFGGFQGGLNHSPYAAHQSYTPWNQTHGMNQGMPMNQGLPFHQGMQMGQTHGLSHTPWTYSAPVAGLTNGHFGAQNVPSFVAPQNLGGLSHTPYAWNYSVPMAGLSTGFIPQGIPSFGGLSHTSAPMHQQAGWNFAPMAQQWDPRFFAGAMNTPRFV